MKINAQGLELLKSFEGCRLKAYQDQVGIWTIGYGSTLGVTEGMVWTQEEADEALARDLARFESGVDDCLEVDVNENEFSALVCFAYNVGLGSLNKSHLLRKLNNEDKAGAAEEFVRWDRAGGLVDKGLHRRRLAEKALFLSPLV